MSCVPSSYHLLTAAVMSRHYYFLQKTVHCQLHISLECKKCQWQEAGWMGNSTANR